MNKILRNRYSIPIMFIFLAILSSFVAVYALRENNLRMLELRDQLYKADQDNKDVEVALTNLRSYVHSHMNTDLSSGGISIKPPIQLKYKYERLVAEQESKKRDENSRLYTEAQEYCEAQNRDFSGRNRVQCVSDYVSSRNSSINEYQIPDSLYKFDFISPKWSPDLAGWSIVIAGLSILLCLITWVVPKFFVRS